MLRLGNAHKIEQAHFLCCALLSLYLQKQAWAILLRNKKSRNEVKEKEKLGRETLGKFFYDLAKIAFTALVVGSIVSVTAEQKKF